MLSLEGLNVTLPGEKIGHHFGMQLTWLHTDECTSSGSTRNVFLYASNAKDCFDWYTAIRHCKLYWLSVRCALSSSTTTLIKVESISILYRYRYRSIARCRSRSRCRPRVSSSAD